MVTKPQLEVRKYARVYCCKDSMVLHFRFNFIKCLAISLESRGYFIDCIICLFYVICTCLTPFWSVPDFWKIKLERSSLTKWIFSLQKSISKLIFVGYTGSKNPVLNRLKIGCSLNLIKYRWMGCQNPALWLVGQQ